MFQYFGVTWLRHSTRIRLASILCDRCRSPAGGNCGPNNFGCLSQYWKQSMMLICAGLIVLPLPIAAKLYVLRGTALATETFIRRTQNLRSAGAPFHGFVELSQSVPPGDRVIHNSLYRIGSFVYLEQKNLLSTIRARRATIYGIRDALTNTITFVRLFYNGRLVPRLGMSVALAVVPLMMFAGMLVLAVSQF